MCCVPCFSFVFMQFFGFDAHWSHFWYPSAGRAFASKAHVLTSGNQTSLTILSNCLGSKSDCRCSSK